MFTTDHQCGYDGESVPDKTRACIGGVVGIVVK